MTKLAITLRRREGTSVGEFREYYREEHAPPAADLSGLKRYAVSFPSDPESASYDALAELYFPDGETMASAFDSDLGREVAADAEAFADMDAAERVVLEEDVVVDRARRPRRSERVDRPARTAHVRESDPASGSFPRATTTRKG